MAFEPCPHLPKCRDGLNWRALNTFRSRERGRGGDFYLACLEYGQHLWTRRLPARAILCLDRAFGADVEPEDPILRQWPLPYEAMAWFLAHVPADVFVGNPRVHFQHYADRMNEPRKEQRRWRAWAGWYLARVIQPQWPADPRHTVEEPSFDRIFRELVRHGHPGEADRWARVAGASGQNPMTSKTA